MVWHWAMDFGFLRGQLINGAVTLAVDLAKACEKKRCGGVLSGSGLGTLVSREEL